MAVNPVGTNRQPAQQQLSFMERHPYQSAAMMGAGPALMGLGALSGGGMGNFMFGRKPRTEQMPLYTPQGQESLNWLMSQGRQNADFGGIEDRYKKQFNEETIPGLAERFSAMGGGQRSSAFQGALGRAGSDLNSQLAALRSQYGMQQLGMGLRPQFENVMHPAQPGFLQNVGSSIMSMLPMLAGI